MNLINASATILLIKFVLLNVLRFGLLLVTLGRVIKERRLKNDFSLDLIKSTKTTSIMLIILSLINADELSGLIGVIIAIISLIFTIDSKKSVESNIEMAVSKLKSASLFNLIAVLLNVIRLLFGDMI